LDLRLDAGDISHSGAELSRGIAGAAEQRERRPGSALEDYAKINRISEMPLAGHQVAESEADHGGHFLDSTLGASLDRVLRIADIVFGPGPQHAPDRRRGQRCNAIAV